MKDLFMFIGEDGSMGYKHGEVYLLEIWGVTKPVIKSPILVPEYIATQIPYSNWNTFLQNWKRI